VPGFGTNRAMVVVCLRDATVVATDNGHFFWWGVFQLKNELADKESKPSVMLGLKGVEVGEKKREAAGLLWSGGRVACVGLGL
jgi:hypothetical protein